MSELERYLCPRCRTELLPGPRTCPEVEVATNLQHDTERCCAATEKLLAAGYALPEHEGQPILWAERSVDPKHFCTGLQCQHGPLMIRVGGGYSVRAATLAAVDRVRWIMAACPTPETLRGLADSLESGRDRAEVWP